MLLKGKKERHPAAPALGHQHRLGPQESDVTAGALPAGSEGRAGQIQVSKSYVHILQSLHSAPIRHEVDLSSSGGDGERRAEGVCAGQGEEREAGASLVSSRGRASSQPHRKLVCLGSLAPIKMPEVSVTGAFICMLDPTDGTGDSGASEGQAFGYQASGDKGLRRAWGPTEERSLVLSQGGDVGSP